jgi:hypothetical protein
MHREREREREIDVCMISISFFFFLSFFLEKEYTQGYIQNAPFYPFRQLPLSAVPHASHTHTHTHNHFYAIHVSLSVYKLRV